MLPRASTSSGGKGHTSPKIAKIKNEVAKMSFNLSEHFRCWKVRQVEREQGVNYIYFMLDVKDLGGDL